MADDDTKPDDKTGDDKNSGAKKALEAERKLRREAEAEAKAEKAKTADLEKRLGAIEAGGKGENEKLTEQLATLQKDLDEERVMRLKAEVASEKGLTTAQAKRLTGTSREELLDDADDLLDAFPAPPVKDDDGDDEKGTGGGQQQRRPVTQRPAEKLKAGTGTDDAPVEETDVKKLGERMFAS